MIIKTRINEWEHEPNHVEWRDEKTGLTCQINRHLGWGHLCGYVGVPLGHCLYGMSLDGVESIITDNMALSFADFKDGSNLFWIGFDCANLGEIKPFMAEAEYYENVVYVYRNIDYARAYCEKLAGLLRNTKVNRHKFDVGLPK